MSPCRLIAAILLLAMPLGAQSQMTTGVIEGVVSPRVSLYAGLRYEASLMPQPPVPNPVLPFTSEVPGDLGMWQPRVGLAWNPRAGGRTVVRFGGGIFHA